jgi:phage terminase small subunit
MARSMSPKRRVFAEEYVVDLNGTAAAKRAGYSQASATGQAAEMLATPEVKGYVAELLAERSRRTEISQDDVLLELAAIAFARIDEVAPWDESGPHLVSSADLPDHVKAAVASVKVKRRREVMREGKEVTGAWEVEEFEVRPWDKLAALDKLARHLGMYQDETNDRDQTSGALVERFLSLPPEQLSALLAKPVDLALEMVANPVDQV